MVGIEFEKFCSRLGLLNHVHLAEGIPETPPPFGKRLSEMRRVLDSLEAVNIGRLVQRARRLDQASLTL